MTGPHCRDGAKVQPHIYVAAHMKALRDANTIEVAQGDLIGASPLISAAFHDEPSVDFLGKIGVQVSAVGNHEFDEGYAERRDDGCGLPQQRTSGYGLPYQSLP